MLKLDEPVPVELRYETILVEDGKVHIYKDVYDQNTNTEENLRVALEKNGIRLEDLSEDERTQILEALNAMSAHPGKQLSPKPANANVSPATSVNANGNDNQNTNQVAAPKRIPAPRKPIGKRQKEVVVEIVALKGMGYPAPVDLDTGSGKPARKLTATASRP